MEVITLLSKIFGGAATGYITNSLALQMLFRKVGPFGGVILKTKNEFISNASQLVERDIINHKTIEEKLDNKEFKNVFSLIIFEIFENYLKEECKNIYWKDIPEFRKNIDIFENMILNKGKAYSFGYMDILNNNIYLEDIFTDIQINSLSDEISSIIKKKLFNKPRIDELFLKLYDNNKEKKVGEFIPESVLLKLSQNIKCSQPKYLKEIEGVLKNNIDIEDSLNKNKELINKINDRIIEKNVFDFIPDINLKEKINQIKKFKDNPEKINNEIFDKITELILYILINIDISVIELFSSRFIDDIKSKLVNIFSYLSDELIIWLELNKEELDQLVKDSIKEVMENDSGIKNSIKLLIFNAYSDKNLIDVFIKKLKKDEKNKFINRLIEHFFTILKEKSIGEIFAYIIKSNFIDNKDIKKALFFLLDIDHINIKQWLNNTNLKDLLGNKSENLIESIIKLLYQKYVNEDFLRRKSNDYIENIQELGELKLKQILNNESLEQVSSHIQKLIKDNLIKEEDNFKTKVEEYIKEYIKNKNLENIVDNKNKFIKEIWDQLASLFKYKVLENRYKKPIKLLDYLNKDHLINFSNSMLEVIKNNLSNILKGNIKNLVSKNLNKLSAEEVRSTIENFMGRELKPITYLGALLGLGAGALMYFIPGLSLEFNIFIYGFIGYLTNVIALQMIFKPYYSKRIFGRRIPLTPGIVAKNKQIFANSMGDFVDKELISSRQVNQLVRENREDIKSSLKTYIKKNNFNSVTDFVRSNSEQINNKIYPLYFNYLKSNSQNFIKKTTDYIGNLKLNQINFEQFDKIINKKNLIQDFNNNLFTYINSKSLHFLSCKNSIETIFPDFLKNKISDLIKNFIYIKLDNVIFTMKHKSQFIDWYNNFYQDLISDYCLKDLFSSIDYDILREKLKDFIISNFDSKYFSDKINYYVKNKFFNSDQTSIELKKIMGKQIINYLINNQTIVVNNILNNLLAFLKNERNHIKDNLIYYIKNSNKDNLFFNLFKKTGFNLIDAEETIGKAIDHFLDFKFADFLNNNKDELEDIYTDLLPHFLDLNLKKSKIVLPENWVKNDIQNIFDDRNFRNNFKDLINLVLDKNLDDLFKQLGYNSGEHLYEIFAEEINIFATILDNNANILKDKINNMIDDIITTILNKIKANEIFNDINSEEIEHIINNLFIKLTQDSEILNILLKSIKKDIYEEIKDKKFDDFINKNILYKDLNKLFKKLINNSILKNKIKSNAQDIINNLIPELIQEIDEKSIEYILDIILESILKAFEEHGNKLIDTLYIKETTVSEINKMGPDEIEEMFNSFAGRYFKRLKLYGWIGGGIGAIFELLPVLLS
ncbi:MAG: DUF445 family protein [archaeon]